MFTGIIESLGKVVKINRHLSNIDLVIEADFVDEIHIDQSIAHNGVCLTVVAIDKPTYTVTAIDETLQKTNLNHLTEGSIVNLERCMKMNGRLDGHIVQGHVDQTATCTAIEDASGSTLFTFTYQSETNVVIEKGSVCINGISLTVINVKDNQFSVAIIPYTLENTNLHTLTVGSIVNIEFDIIGKYIQRLMPVK